MNIKYNQTMRKHWITCNLAIWLWASLVLPFNAQAEETKPYEKKVEREFPISPSGLVEISNSYGVIDIQTWEQNVVKIEVLVNVEAGNQLDAQKFFDRVEINFSTSANNVQATTEIEPPKSWITWLFGGDEAESFNIQYSVHLPASVRLELVNKYGDIYVAAMHNHMEIDLRYGSLRLDRTTGDVDLILANGKGSIGSARNVDADVAYSSLRLGSVTQLDILSRYSRIEIDNAGSIDSETKYDNYRINSANSLENYGRYDDFYIDRIGDFEMETKYTNVVIETLLHEADINLTNGLVNIKEVQKGFSDIEIEASYAPVKLGMANEAAFRYEVFSEYGSVNINNTERTFVLEGVTQEEYKGFRVNKEAEAKVEVYMKYGSLELK